MAYKLTAADFDEVDNSEKSKNESKGYKLTVDDIDEVEKNQKGNVIPPYMGGLTANQSKNILKGLFSGLLKTGENTGRYLAKGFPISEDTINRHYNPASETVNKIYSPDVAATDEGKISYNVGQMLPWLAMPMKKAKPLAQAGQAIIGSELLSPIFNPNKSVPDAYIDQLLPSAGAGVLAALPGVPKGIGKILTMGGRATPEEFVSNVAAAGNKPIGVGTLSRSPFGSWIEQQGLPNIPLTGHAQKNMQVGEMLDKEVKNVLNGLDVIPENKPRYRYTGDSNEPFEPVLKETQSHKISKNVEKNFEINQTEKRRLYGVRDKIAQDLDVKVDPVKASEAAREELDKIQRELNRKGTTNFSPEVVKDLKSIGIKAYDKSGNEINQSIPFQDINFENGNYGEKARMAKMEGRLNDQRVYEKLNNALKSDMYTAIENSGSRELKDAQYLADTHYKDKIAPILKNEALYAHATGQGSKDSIISDFMKTGAYDKPEQVNALLQNLDKDHRKQFAHEFLTRGLKELDGKEEFKSDAVLNLYGKIGNETKRLMFSPTQIKLLDRAFKARKMMGGSIDQMFHPKTGYSAAKIGGIASVPATAFSSAGIGRLMSAYLTSKLAKSVYLKGANLKNVPSEMAINPAALTQLASQNQQESND